MSRRPLTCPSPAGISRVALSTNLSRYFQQQRLGRGLKPGQLARLAGCVNVQKNGGRIRTFELGGYIGRELFEKIAAALGIDAGTVARLVAQDRRELYQDWLAWVNEPIRPYLVIRVMAAVYSSRPVPPALTTEEAEGWAGAVAGEIKRRCYLVEPPPVVLVQRGRHAGQEDQGEAGRPEYPLDQGWW
jgi:hypothetical protein